MIDAVSADVSALAAIVAVEDRVCAEQAAAARAIQTDWYVPVGAPIGVPTYLP